ncbi:8-oxo-dGTP diphosphatase MutT [Microbulbifer flavimaris]|uniref:8-oxo-dGTP diphosphatase n=1 Tax=Microbulbifer flavimaris TaxID=1781068 RepID=A0ABX4I1S0_9GAMM|nr:MULTISPECIES: 8-oxo-dGTP diphosphatase MutT [Microbulbifer]KUJ83802.1 hypothetical protein AVO43_08225 [Microbulbifer sp. ZGT114]PCO05978.1 8-oxo-dGTP diphosphatase MutT [Microbulbifer flavimaris]
MKKQIDVAAAIICKENKIFAARRRVGKHLAGLWELPGGKLEEGETPEQCLARELEEELNIKARIGSLISENIFDYGAKAIRLMAYEVKCFSGDFRLIDHDAMCWLALNELNTIEWAPADIPLLDRYKELTEMAVCSSSSKSNGYIQENG